MADTGLHPRHMGLNPAPLSDWLKPQPGDDNLLTLRQRLIDTHRDEVLAVLPQAHSAIAELASRLHMARAEPVAALSNLGTRLAEDLCILTRHGLENFVLSAGVLCFPNRWRLREKIGGTVLEAHAPVPEYAALMTTAVDRFLARLKPERFYHRGNWGLSSSPELFLPAPTPPVNPVRDTDFFLRREEQGFLKLPQTGAVVFSIRTVVTPWAETPAALREGILETIAGLSPDWLCYKSISG